jgi:hypothetical protein
MTAGGAVAVHHDDGVASQWSSPARAGLLAKWLDSASAHARLLRRDLAEHVEVGPSAVDHERRTS